MSPIFLTQVNAFYRQLFLLNVTLKYTLFPLNHPYFLKYSFLRKMHTCFCRGESVEYHCVKSVQMRSFSVPYSIRMPENTDQKKKHFPHRVRIAKTRLILYFSLYFFSLQSWYILLKIDCEKKRF